MNRGEKLDAEELSYSWAMYKAGSIEHRNQLMVHYSSVVQTQAAKVGATLPSMVDRDDLVSYGMFGLIDAMEKYDAERGVQFETYAPRRVRGAIIDGLREADWVPRSVRVKARDVEKAREEVEAVLGRPAKHAEIADHLSISLQDYWALTSQANVKTVGGLQDEHGDEERFGGSFVSDPVANLEQILEVGEITTIVSDAISQMDERSKVILVLYYIHEMTLAEIGRVLGVTESRVCQLQSKALSALGDFLSQGYAAA